MKNRFFYLTFVFLTFVFYKAEAQNIQASAALKQYTIRIGDQTKLFISVRQPKGVQVVLPKLADTIVSKVQVVNEGKPDTVADKNNAQNIEVTQGYTITSFDAGTYELPPFKLTAGKDTVSTNAVTLQVETVKVDTTKAIYDIKQPMAVSYTFLDWLKDNWWWLALIVVGLGALGGLLYYLKNRPVKEKTPEPVKQPVIPVYVAAINQLNALRDKKLWQQGEVKQYYIEMSDILREYLEKRYAIKTHEKTTDEIFFGLRNIAITNENRETLRQILTLADLVKFAKEKPLPSENEQCMDNSIRFVSATRQEEAVGKPEGGPANV